MLLPLESLLTKLLVLVLEFRITRMTLGALVAKRSAASKVPTRRKSKEADKRQPTDRH